MDDITKNKIIENPDIVIKFLEMGNFTREFIAFFNSQSKAREIIVIESKLSDVPRLEARLAELKK